MIALASKSAIGRAAAAAVLAILLSACGKSVTVSGGGGGGELPTEERLYVGFTPAQLLPAWVRGRANWAPTAAERAGPNRDYTDLVTVAERASIDPAKVQAAAGLRPSFAQDSASYTRPAPYTRVRPDNDAFWQESATDSGSPPGANRLVAYWAPSGVSQSSRGASGSVHDRVHVGIGAPGPGFYTDNRPTYHVELRYAGNPSAPGRLTQWTIDNRPPPGTYSSPLGSTYRLPRSWTGPDGERAQRFSQNIPGGELKLFVRTDRADWSDTDWLATGMWWTRTTSAPYTSFGVFADGGDPFDRNDILPLTGTATYAGVAHGVFSYGTDTPLDQRASSFPGTNLLFEGNASLTADFGSARAGGSVSGRIYNMKSGSAPGAAEYAPGFPEITLGDASLGGLGGLFGGGGSLPRANFEGAASMTYAGRSYSGHWGGQFFGNAAAGAAGADARPGSAAGTFGVTAGRGGSLVGTFEVHR